MRSRELVTQAVVDLFDEFAAGDPDIQCQCWYENRADQPTAQCVRGDDHWGRHVTRGGLRW